MSDAKPVTVWSCGGGTQSAAIAALIIQGRLPRPDHLLMVDTQREKRATWEYANATLMPALEAAGLKLVVIPKSEHATVDLYSVNGETLLLPAFSDVTGTKGKMTNFCSNEWKSRVLQRWLTTHHPAPAFVFWIGMSRDEMTRVKASKSAKWQKHYPLVFDVGLRRSECIDLVHSMGWPTPPRSSCWMCPNQTDAQWLDLQLNYPDDFKRAVDLETELRLRDHHMFFHESLKPLGEVNFEANNDRQLNILSDPACESGHCFV